MDVSTDGATPDHDAAGRFKRGNCGHAAKRRRVAQRVEELSADYDAGTPALQILLAICAKHLDDAHYARTALARTRATNAATRLLSQIPRRKPRTLTLAEVLRGG